MIKYTFLLTILSLSLFGEEIVDPNTDVSFPKEVSFAYEGKDYQLEATGVATRKKMGFLIYSVASYLEKGEPLQGSDKFEALVSSSLAKQLSVHWLMNVRGKKIQDGYVKIFEKVFSKEEYEELSPQIEKFLAFLDPGVKKGTQQVFRSMNGDTVLAISDGEVKATIKSKLFQEKFWDIWFGKKAVVNKNNLIKFL